MKNNASVLLIKEFVLRLFLIDLNTVAPKSRKYPLLYAITYTYSYFR